MGPYNDIRGTLVPFPSKSTRLYGFLAKGKKRSRRAVVYVHGMTGNFYAHGLVRAFMDAAPRAKWDFFSIENKGTGIISKFYGPRGKETAGTALERFTDCVDDLDGAVRALKQRGYRDIVLCGHSTGCQKITYYQSKKQNRSVRALVLLAPGDDYNLAQKGLGKRFSGAVSAARKMVREKKGDWLFRFPGWKPNFSAKRFLSFADPKNPEAQVFNYDGRLHHFSRVHVPVFVSFGTTDFCLLKPAEEYERILSQKTRSREFSFETISGADHSYMGKENAAVQMVLRWLKHTL